MVALTWGELNSTMTMTLHKRIDSEQITGLVLKTIGKGSIADT